MISLTEGGDGSELALHPQYKGCRYLLPVMVPLTEGGDGPELALHLNTRAAGLSYL